MKAFISNIFNAVSDNLISGGAYYLIVKGVFVTFMITVTAWIIAFILGIAISYFMSYEKKIVSNIGRAVCFIFRSVPVLLTIWLFYYCIFGGGSINGMLIIGLAIGLWGAGHLAEIIANAADKESSKISSGIKDKLEHYYFSLLVPQTLEDSLFQLKRLAVHILQWTCVAGYVSVNDLTQVMYGIGQRTMYPFFSIAFSALLYLIAVLLIEFVFKLLRNRLMGEKRSED